MAGTNKKLAGGGFHHLFMKVRDLDASIKFYTEELGFVEKTSWGTGSRRIVLLDTGDGNYFEITQGDPEKPQELGVFQHVALRTDDCDAATEVARAAGAEIPMEPNSVTLSANPPFEVRISFLKGPDGELVELFQNDRT